MKLSGIIVASSIAASSAFVPAPRQQPALSTELNVATKGKIGPVRRAISSVTKDNFSATLTEIEPFLLEDTGITFYKKSMRRLGMKARVLGVEMPADYARDAKCTAKRREKQDAFCQIKAEEAAAAAAAAEEEAAAAVEKESAAEEEPATED
ncbi:hypothetical protein THAOC_19084 [Thalassiosira oceanica]|uniref:Uncharacterized protein n=1 Tax=Thalassiosira oceanica TaxID=159749 RepID=K0S5I6_THAOC|nr:hypothetical protein THAOC_19084 [Thalassiosira oceanica]|eukprot:EJK60540.1 hypothetical protein THAOC_19084 [Thalassiosira oceanica]